MSRARHATSGRKRGLLLVLFLLIFLVVMGAGGFYLWATGASGESRPAAVEIPEGATASDVGSLLEDARVVRSGFAFRVAARLRGIGSSIFAGRYVFQTNMRLEEALDVLEAGPIVETVSMTIPEGLRLEQVADRVAEDLGVERKRFLAEARSGSYTLPPYLPEGTSTVEGFLFPKTYEFTANVTADQFIRRLVDQFGAEVADLDWGRAERLGVSPYEAVIVASLIEREAVLDVERPKVASVIYNRLRQGMLLQIDATVQYALPKHKNRLTYEDYEYPSPYNTYLNQGLPPTPIASPGLASLRAALRPAETNFLFYVLTGDGTGRHAFAETYSDFLRLKEQAQQSA